MSDFYTSRVLEVLIRETLIKSWGADGKELSYTALVTRTSEREPSHPVNGGKPT